MHVESLETRVMLSNTAPTFDQPEYNFEVATGASTIGTVSVSDIDGDDVYLEADNYDFYVDYYSGEIYNYGIGTPGETVTFNITASDYESSTTIPVTVTFTGDVGYEETQNVAEELIDEEYFDPQNEFDETVDDYMYDIDYMYDEPDYESVMENSPINEMDDLFEEELDETSYYEELAEETQNEAASEEEESIESTEVELPDETVDPLEEEEEPEIDPRLQWSAFSFTDEIAFPESSIPAESMLDDLFSITPDGTDSFTNTTTFEATPLIETGDAVDPEGNALPTEKLTNAHTTVTMTQEYTSPDEWIVTQSITKYFDSEENSEADDGTADIIGRDGSTTLTVTVINGTHTIVSYTIENSFSYSSSLEWNNDADDETEGESEVAAVAEDAPLPPEEEEGEETPELAGSETEPELDNGHFSFGFESSSSMTITLEEAIITLPDGRTARMYSLGYATSQSYSSTISAASTFKHSEGELKKFEKPAQEEGETGEEPNTENPEEPVTADGAASPSENEPSTNNEEPEPEVAADPELEFEHGGNGSAIDFSSSFNYADSFSNDLGLNLTAIVPDGESLDDATVTGAGSFGLATSTSTSNSDSINIQLQTSAGDTSTNDASHEYISFASNSSGGNSGDFTFDIEFDIDSSEDDTENPETPETNLTEDAIDPEASPSEEPDSEPDTESTEEPDFEFSYSTSNADGGSSVVLYSQASTVTNQYGTASTSEKLTLSGTFTMAASFGFSIAEGITALISSSGGGKTDYVSISQSTVDVDLNAPDSSGLEYTLHEIQNHFNTDSKFSSEATLVVNTEGLTFSNDYSVDSTLKTKYVHIYGTDEWVTDSNGNLTDHVTGTQTTTDKVEASYKGDNETGFISKYDAKSRTVDDFQFPVTSNPNTPAVLYSDTGWEVVSQEQNVIESEESENDSAPLDDSYEVNHSRKLSPEEKQCIEYFLKAALPMLQQERGSVRVARVLSKVTLWDSTSISGWHTFHPWNVIAQNAQLGSQTATTLGPHQYYQNFPEVGEQTALIAHETFHSIHADASMSTTAFLGGYVLDSLASKWLDGAPNYYSGNMSEVYGHAIEHAFDEMLLDPVFERACETGTTGSLPESYRELIQMKVSAHLSEGFQR